MNEEIKRGNKLIAKFLGGKTPKNDEHLSKLVGYDIGTNYVPIEDLLYFEHPFKTLAYGVMILPIMNVEQLPIRDDYNWLIHVVEKIEDELGYSVIINEHFCRIIVDPEEMVFEWQGAESKKEAIWNALVKFCEWYNQKEE